MPSSLEEVKNKKRQEGARSVRKRDEEAKLQKINDERGERRKQDEKKKMWRLRE